MPFQQISLDQSIYNKPKKSPVSSALRSSQYKGPIVNPSQGWTGLPGFSDEAKGIYQQNSFVEKQKAEWAASDKAKKAERDMQMQKLQEVGMQTVKQAQQQQQQAQQQQAQAKQQIESNPGPAAKEMYELMKTLPDEAKQQLLQQIFKPTATSNFIEAGGVKKNMPDKYNPIANVFLEKGWAMFDPKGNVNLSEPVATYDKGTFEIKTEGGMVIQQNTATGEIKELGSTDDPNTPDAVVKQIKDQALDVVKTSDGKVSLEDATYDAAIDNGYNEEDAKTIATFTPMPEGDKKKNKVKEWWAKMTKPSGETPAYLGKTAATTPSFKEENVTALVSVVSNNVTPAERAYLKSQGATDADIDEAIKRKGE